MTTLAYALAATHVGIYGAGAFGERDLRRAVIRNTTLSLRSFRERPYVILTHALAHASPLHVLVNSFMTVSWLPPLVFSLGAPRALMLYAGSAVAGGAGQLWWNDASGFRETRSVGASGALSGLLLHEAVRFPSNRILLFGLVPMTNAAFSALFMAGNVYGCASQTDAHGGGVAFASHIGGGLFGAAFAVARARLR